MIHATKRAMERVPGVCPSVLIRGCLWAIKNNRHDILEFVEWRGKDKGVWRGRAANGLKFRIVANPIKLFPITIMDGWGK